MNCLLHELHEHLLFMARPCVRTHPPDSSFSTSLKLRPGKRYSEEFLYHRQICLVILPHMLTVFKCYVLKTHGQMARNDHSSGAKQDAVESPSFRLCYETRNSCEVTTLGAGAGWDWQQHRSHVFIRGLASHLFSWQLSIFQYNSGYVFRKPVFSPLMCIQERGKQVFPRLGIYLAVKKTMPSLRCLFLFSSGIILQR